MFENVNSFPLLPRQLSLIDTLTIGIPATILTILPNNKPIQGRFMFNVLKNALPGALAVLFNAVIIYFAAFYASDYINISNIHTMIKIARNDHKNILSPLCAIYNRRNHYNTSNKKEGLACCSSAVGRPQWLHCSIKKDFNASKNHLLSSG